MGLAEEMKKLAEESDKRLRAESDIRLNEFKEERKKVGLKLIHEEIKKMSEMGSYNLQVQEDVNVKLCEYIFDLQDDLRAEGFEVIEQKYAGKGSSWTMIVNW